MKLARRPSPGAIALGVGCGVIAAAVFLNHLGSSSLFSDESDSWHAAAGSFWDVFSRVRGTENTPPLYYLLLHFWIGVFGSGSVWGLRLLSVLGALGAVAGTSWLGNQLSGSGGAVAGGLGAAFSPLILEYAQELRAYALVVATVVLAAAAAVQAVRSTAHQPRWIALATVMSVATVWLHYSGILVALAIGAYVWTSPQLSPRLRRCHAGVVLAALVIIAPLMVIQLRSGHQGGVAPFAKLTATNLIRVIGTPFDGRFVPQAITYLTGAAAVVIACAVLGLSASRRPGSREGLLVLGAIVAPVGGLVLVNVAVWVTNETTYYSLITRYSAVSAPFMLAAIAYTVVRGPLLLRPVVVILVGIACVSGLVGDYSHNTRWPDLGGAFGYVDSSIRSGDAVVLTGYPAEGENSDYYLAQLRRHDNPRVLPSLAGLRRLPAATVEVFIVTDPGTAAGLDATLSSVGWSEGATTQYFPDASVVVATRMPGGVS
jgi:mannosyltransferase